MMKALLIVTALAGQGDYTVEMPSMKACQDARTEITKQDTDAAYRTLCVPQADETEKMRSFFLIFMDMVATLREMEVQGIDNDYNDFIGEEARCVTDCKEQLYR